MWDVSDVRCAWCVMRDDVPSGPSFRPKNFFSEWCGEMWEMCDVSQFSYSRISWLSDVVRCVMWCHVWCKIRLLASDPTWELLHWVMWWDVSDVWCVIILLASGPRTSLLRDVVRCVMCQNYPSFRPQNFFAEWCGEMWEMCDVTDVSDVARCEWCVMCDVVRCAWCVMCDVWVETQETGQKRVRNRSETGQKQVRNWSETARFLPNRPCAHIVFQTYK